MAEMKSSTKNDPAANGWHVDRRIPLALILTFIATVAVQTAAGAWWLSSLNSRVMVLEQASSSRVGYSDRITTLEVEVRGVRRSVDNISSKLDRLMERER